MTQLIPILIEGEKIIQLSQLTIDQGNDLRSWLPVGSIRKLLFQGIELEDCITYESYVYWLRTNAVFSRGHESILDF